MFFKEDWNYQSFKKYCKAIFNKEYLIYIILFNATNAKLPILFFFMFVSHVLHNDILEEQAIFGQRLQTI